MLLQIVVVRDSGADCFGQPQYVPSIGGAIRSFGDESQNPQSIIYKHPGDYILYKLGTYNDATAKMDLLDVPEQIARAVDFVKPDKVN